MSSGVALKGVSTIRYRVSSPSATSRISRLGRRRRLNLLRAMPPPLVSLVHLLQVRAGQGQHVCQAQACGDVEDMFHSGPPDPVPAVGPPVVQALFTRVSQQNHCLPSCSICPIYSASSRSKVGSTLAAAVGAGNKDGKVSPLQALQFLDQFGDCHVYPSTYDTRGLPTAATGGLYSPDGWLRLCVQGREPGSHTRLTGTAVVFTWRPCPSHPSLPSDRRQASRVSHTGRKAAVSVAPENVPGAFHPSRTTLLSPLSPPRATSRSAGRAFQACPRDRT